MRVSRAVAGPEWRACLMRQAYIVFGERRIQAGSHPRNIQPAPSCLKAWVIIVPIGCFVDAFMICSEAGGSQQRRSATRPGNPGLTYPTLDHVEGRADRGGDGSLHGVTRGVSFVHSVAMGCDKPLTARKEEVKWRGRPSCIKFWLRIRFLKISYLQCIPAISAASPARIRAVMRRKGLRGELRRVHEHRARDVGPSAAKQAASALLANHPEHSIKAETTTSKQQAAISAAFWECPAGTAATRPPPGAPLTSACS
jgi:hypothetical protein